MTEIAEAKPWDRYLDDSDRAAISRARFGHRMGFGDRPAIVAIDCQRYMVGERGVQDDRFPSSCGEIGWAAVDRHRRAAVAARAAAVPVFLTRFALDPEGRRYRCLRPQARASAAAGLVPRGTPGGPNCSPKSVRGPGDVVFVKKKPSGFFGTPLLSYLVDRRVDTVIVVGGATSNCVRATVFDLRLVQFPHHRARRRRVRPAADLARDQPVRHGPAVRRRDDDGRNRHPVAITPTDEEGRPR